VKKLFAVLAVSGIVFLLAGLVSRQWWIISKIAATPTWIFLCVGISILLYIFLYWLVEMKGKERWFGIIKPAGTATLTCYLVPYIMYSLFEIYSVKFPDAIRAYPVGLLKSLFLALAVIGATALLGKLRVKLKI
jgi:predicted acyltransferase